MSAEVSILQQAQAFAALHVRELAVEIRNRQAGSGIGMVPRVRELYVIVSALNSGRARALAEAIATDAVIDAFIEN